MYRVILILIICSRLFACTNQVPESTVNENHPGDVIACYRYIQNHDTVILTTHYSKDGISGTLVYNLYQKDKNKGTFLGKMKGDLLLAEYTFQSEGMVSTRPVAFKKEGDTFLEGYGETVIENGREAFVNPDSLVFTGTILLKPYRCDK